MTGVQTCALPIFNQGENRILVIAIFAAWLSYIVQSIGSIDNLGIAVFGYALGGILISLSKDEINRSPRPTPNLRTGVAVLLVVVLVVIYSFYTSETILRQVMRLQPPIDSNGEVLNKSVLTKMQNTKLTYEKHETFLAYKYAQLGYLNAAIPLLEKINNKDPKNFDSRNILAKIFENNGDFRNAIRLREEIKVFDQIGRAHV